jgi:hypothetical protein
MERIGDRLRLAKHHPSAATGLGTRRVYIYDVNFAARKGSLFVDVFDLYVQRSPDLIRVSRACGPDERSTLANADLQCVRIDFQAKGN